MKMQARKWLMGAAMVSFALGSAGATLAGDKAPRTKAPRAPKPPTLDKREVTLLEGVAGKPLTDEQKTQLLQAQETRNAAAKAAADTYMAAKAQVMGMTVEELTAKEAAYRKEHSAKKTAAGGGGAAPATTTTTTTTEPAKQ